MARTITWLHLSDLHACKARAGWDSHRVLNPLQEDLKRMQDKYDLHPDLVFFTGDAAFGQLGHAPGETLAEQFGEAHDFFEQVRAAFDPVVPRENLFLVPGNHDVNRWSVTPDQTLWLDSQTDIDPIIRLIQLGDRQWQRYMERLEEYHKFLVTNGYNHLLEDPKRLIYSAIREVNEIKVGIAGLNSAWSCCRDREHGKLWLGGFWQTGELESKLEAANFSIALIHHPVNWFGEQEDPELWRQIERGFQFCLHGHEHQGWVNATSDGHTRIASAACYDHSDKENGYNFVRLNLDNAKGQVWLRRYERDGGGWIPRIIANSSFG